jgi:3-deoxy-D-manno-octulosonate 8-phosphate phosphatase KdsC-like HAD superfamily phosphatase
VIRDKFKKIKRLLIGFYGVLTNGKLYFSADDEYMKMFSTLD